MRIQNNIAAMNAHRVLGGNNTATAKSLEKLSSGFRINRAGDDAAGLAISEKMRAQIKGLETAQKNANDGISLVQTAEGALTEVHSMLNRMTELATQSANGTIQNEVDREAIQKEVNALNEEIDRIAKSTNFNGIKLLDGQLGSTSGAGKKTANLDAPDSLKNKITFTPATANSVTTANFADTNLAQGDKVSYSLTVQDAQGRENTIKLDFTFDAANKKLVSSSGQEYATAANNKAVKGELQSAVLAELKANDEFSSQFDITTATDAFKIDAKVKGSGGPKIMAFAQSHTAAATNVTTQSMSAFAGRANAVDAFTSLALGATGTILSDITKLDEAPTFSVNGQQFLLVDSTMSDDDLKKIDGSITVFKYDATSNATKDASIQAAASGIAQKTGAEVKTSGAAGSLTLDFVKVGGSTNSTSDGQGLTLQVGDSSDKFQKVTVNVGDMSARGLGIQNLNVSTLEDANGSIDKIKSAINTVSSTRADLGAVQNRLEHTINNLGVAQENITAAESRIRDVDMAKEMMTFTKNNILTQAAQAMLAQANQQPQGVLQLLR